MHRLPVEQVLDQARTQFRQLGAAEKQLVSKLAQSLAAGQRAVLLVLNQMPKEFNQQLARHGRLGVATAQRSLQRSRQVLVDFGELPVWMDDEQPLF